ncbi:ribosome biogenesis GTP-binding protein YihA/YsxC [Paraburkholderia caballeronis]|uniref:Probable GTP-binding protein EngB n=1 Tax=Paraburkholderia caballeronis TaxID=416943 RepID=A0A1H7UXE7_9BURK|nr:ribosome biogenesis GTP-binding protein YihA/YsxC [Paraburkholderia caballeronis]PXW17415.1 cell division checkpoint GTPase YihA [Paraburkholderia caballeronis]PXW94867.1 cell division checkpoint GTPase YihA [Paraburkholderia caballeronis]RAJ90765.1 cell division checkpoint GTPase YihA [Paraburkholderia caballeronis]TDV05620.1 cell division checkpoint GTPase YihA [Paraburkholderia caballeronis]TDV09361.1 cell division checkpoint GTPase YihA [Paraburkholderia caballeronis]
MAFLLHQARFFTTVNHLRDLPATARPEVAFAGRSNAGKSTAINLLCNQKRLAFASKTPGRTQHINYFSVGPDDDPVGYLVDLPGYGYAEVPEASKAHWEALLSAYLRTRSQLCGLILMMDARRPLTDLDRRMIEWFAPTGRPIHALLTKCDKLTRQESVVALRTAQKGFDEYRKQGYESELSAQLFSALKRIGLDEAHERIESWIAPKTGDAADDSAEA